MNRLRPRHKLILDHTTCVIGEQCAVLVSDLLSQFPEPPLHHRRGCIRIKIMNGEFVKTTTEKVPLDSTRFGIGQKSISRLNFEDPQSRLISGQSDRSVHSMFGCPSNQLLWRIAPAQSERRGQHGLSKCMPKRQRKEDRSQHDGVEVVAHKETYGPFRAVRKSRWSRSGMLLLESMIALTTLTLIGLLLLKLSINILSPRQWTLHQTLADAYMSFERSLAERAPFEDIESANSLWPLFPLTATQVVEIGRLPDARPINATITRTRMEDTVNFPQGNTAVNPSAMRVWKAQSVLTYEIGDRTYAKSRTVLRSQ